MRPGSVVLRLASLALIGAALSATVGTSAPRTATAAPKTRSSAALDKGKVAEAVKSLDEAIRDLGGTTSVMFVDLETGETLAAAHEHDAKNPASNAKIPTAAAALAILGPDHRFTTGLFGKAKDGAVDELVLRGRGDPTLGTDDLGGLVRDLKAAGVKRVGRILVDQSYFDAKFVPPAFEQQPNEWAYFRAPVAAVSLNENTITLRVRAGADGDKADVVVDPPGFVDVEGSISTGKKGSAESITCELSAKGDRLLAKVGGHLPEGSRLVPIVKRVDDPRRLAGYALRAVLKEQGFEVGDEVKLGGDEEKRALTTHSSRPLGEIVALLGKDSDNFAAEMLFKATGAGSGGSTSAEDGAKAVEAYLKEHGALDGGMKVLNGSGLFDANRSTAYGLVTLLGDTYKSATIAPEFVAQLSIGGVDGTLKHRFSKWAKRRAVRAKTGTLAGAVALSGYVLGPDGRQPVAFSMLVNGVNGKASESRAAMDKAVDVVAEQLWK